MKERNHKRRTADFHFEIKSLKEDGTFTGYGSVFNNVDYGRDLIVKGAFANSLTDYASHGRKVPMLWQHDSDNPIGFYTSLKEDDHGLLVEGKLLLGVQKAKEAYILMEAGAISGLSIGYSTNEYSVDEKTGIRSLLDVDLYEISVVTFPMNDDARINVVKNKISEGEMPSLKEFEAILRDVGFSKSQSKAIACHGLSKLLRCEAETETEAKAVAEVLRSFTIPTIGKQNASK